MMTELEFRIECCKQLIEATDNLFEAEKASILANAQVEIAKRRVAKCQMQIQVAQRQARLEAELERSRAMPSEPGRELSSPN